MSANRDKTQKITFVYSNLYQIYKAGAKQAEKAAPAAAAPQSSPLPPQAPLGLSRAVLKADDLRAGQHTPVQISDFKPTELIGKRIARPASLPPVSETQKIAVAGLRDNLSKLNDLHSRLRFMLEELEDLVKE